MKAREKSTFLSFIFDCITCSPWTKESCSSFLLPVVNQKSKDYVGKERKGLEPSLSHSLLLLFRLFVFSRVIYDKRKWPDRKQVKETSGIFFFYDYWGPLSFFLIYCFLWPLCRRAGYACSRFSPPAFRYCQSGQSSSSLCTYRTRTRSIIQ